MYIRPEGPTYFFLVISKEYYMQTLQIWNYTSQSVVLNNQVWPLSNNKWQCMTESISSNIYWKFKIYIEAFYQLQIWLYSWSNRPLYQLKYVFHNLQIWVERYVEFILTICPSFWPFDCLMFFLLWFRSSIPNFVIGRHFRIVQMKPQVPFSQGLIKLKQMYNVRFFWISQILLSLMIKAQKKLRQVILLLILT